MSDIVLKREVYHDGSHGHFFGIEVDGTFHEIRLAEPYRPSFQPSGRFSPELNNREHTEHHIIVAEGNEALIYVDGDGRITDIMRNTKDIDSFNVPRDHEFFKFAFTMQPASNIFPADV